MATGTTAATRTKENGHPLRIPNNEHKERTKTMDNTIEVFVVVVTRQENHNTAELVDTAVFSTRELATNDIHERYLNAKLEADEGVGVFDSDYSDDGRFSIVDADGTITIGCVRANIIDGTKYKYFRLPHCNPKRNMI